MRVICNRPGGYRLYGVVLQKGENIVDDEVWARAVARMGDRWLRSVTTTNGNRDPALVIQDDAGQPAAEGEAPELSAKDKIALIERCDNLDDLAQHETGETRKTVLTAIERRMASLAEAEYRPKASA